MEFWGKITKATLFDLDFSLTVSTINDISDYEAGLPLLGKTGRSDWFLFLSQIEIPKFRKKYLSNCKKLLLLSNL